MILVTSGDESDLTNSQTLDKSRHILLAFPWCKPHDRKISETSDQISTINSPFDECLIQQAGGKTIAGSIWSSCCVP